MATIQQLFVFGGRMGKLKIRRQSFNPGTYLEVMDIRNKTVLGWLYRDGHKAKACDSYHPEDLCDWEIYKEPTHRQATLYSAIVISASSFGNHKGNPEHPLDYERTVSLFETEEAARKQYGERFVKLQTQPVVVEVPL